MPTFLGICVRYKKNVWIKHKAGRDPRDLPALFFLSAEQFAHFQLNVTELVLLALVLLLNGAGLVTVRNKHQTAIHNFNGEGTAFIKASGLKPLPFKMDCGRGFGLVILRHVSHGVITFCFCHFIYCTVLPRMRLSHHSTPV